MPRLTLVLAVLLLATTAVPAQMHIDHINAGARSTVQQLVVVEGYLIDTKCAQAHRNTLVRSASTHPTACLAASQSREFGVVMLDGSWAPFDEDSAKKVAKFLVKASAEKGILVKAKCSVQGNLLSVKDLKELKPDTDKSSAKSE